MSMFRGAHLTNCWGGGGGVGSDALAPTFLYSRTRAAEQVLFWGDYKSVPAKLGTIVTIFSQVQTRYAKHD